MSRVDPANMAEVLTARVRHHDERRPAQRVNSALEDFPASLSSVLTPGRRSLPMQVDKFAEELKSAREYNDTINRLLQVRTSWLKRRLPLLQHNNYARENPTVQPPNARHATSIRFAGPARDRR